MEPVKENIEMNTLVTSLNSFIEKGFTEDYIVTAQGLKAVKTEKIYGPAQVKVVDFHRFEGTSDPGDESILYAIETDDGEKGTLVDSYGPQSDAKVNIFMKQVIPIAKAEHT